MREKTKSHTKSDPKTKIDTENPTEPISERHQGLDIIMDDESYYPFSSPYLNYYYVKKGMDVSIKKIQKKSQI
jgi:hypothetical protein